MDRPVRLLVLAVALSLCAAVAASADTIDTEPFTISGLSGPLAGNTYTGSITWDTSVSTSLTSFSTDFPGWSGATLADLAFAPYYSDPGIELFYAPAPVGNTNAFAFFGSNPLFTYGTTEIVDTAFLDAGQGTVSWGAITSTPEPGISLLLATGLAGVLGAVRRRQTS